MLAGTQVEANSLVLLVDDNRRSYLELMTPGDFLTCPQGRLDYDKVIGQAYGAAVQTQLGHSFWLFPPSIDDIMKHLKRKTPILYPKDLGYIAMKMGIVPGVQVIEAGTGSGALSLLLAMLVGEEGRVYSYERKAATQALARENVAKIGLSHRVDFIESDIRRGFQQREVQALFLDLDNPWDYLKPARAALRGGGFFGARVSTAQQLAQTLAALDAGPWALVQAEELWLREWQVHPQHSRPAEQMMGHTGFLIFARAMGPHTPPSHQAEAAAWEE